MKRLVTQLFYLAALVASGTAQAADITVDAGGTCTLADAITSANTDTATGGCTAGSGEDTIHLQQDVLLTAKLPEITSTITIEGNGHKIDGQKNSAVGSVLHVASSGNLILKEATVTGGIGDKDPYERRGGGIYNKGALSLNSSTVSNNEAQWGGGIDNWGGTVTLTNSTVSDNMISTGFGGGGITNWSGTVTLTNSTVKSNKANYGGGGIYNYGGGTVTLTNSTVSGNSVSLGYGGGGIYNEEGTVTLTNSTVSGNSDVSYAGTGGGICNSGTVTLLNSTVSGNSVSHGYGGGIANYDGMVTLTSSTVSGNSADTGNEVYNGSTITADSYNLFSHSGETNAQAFSGFTPGAKDVTATSDGTKPTALAAILSPLASNGGPTQTHALPPGSPAIDLDTTCSIGLTTDQRGMPRPVGAGCDAGSFEAGGTCTSTIIVDAGGICTLPDAITAANTDAPSGGCPAGCGDDTIILETNVALAAQLPQITSNITIEGQEHIIDGQNNEAVGSVLRVTTNMGVLTLNEATVTGGNCNGASCLSGGGIYAGHAATVTLNNSTVSDNEAKWGGAGGGLYNDGGTVTLTNSTVSGNEAELGGGIDNNSGDIKLINSTVSGNKGSSYGGGISNGETLTLINSTVSDNLANTGGGIHNYSGTVMLTNSTVSGNKASSHGGGIVLYVGTVMLTNSTISGNSVTHGSGGGIHNYGYTNTLILTNSTVSGNSAYYDGGGIYNCGKLTLTNSIVSGNSAGTGNELYHDIDGTITADSYNLFGHSGENNAGAFFSFIPSGSDVTATSDGTKPTALAAILSPLADNGGPTQTHALPPGSPAIDLDKTCSTGLTTDQRGEPRPVGAGCDAGAFEFQGNNHAPVANAGPKQSVVLGNEVCFDGSGSSDADNDPLTYLWTLTSIPMGSTAVLDDPTAVNPCFTADLPGTYTVSLIVNDGTEDSAPSTAEATATELSCHDIALAKLQEAMAAIKALPLSAFKTMQHNLNTPNNQVKSVQRAMQRSLVNQINAAITRVKRRQYAAALRLLQRGILVKTDGCAKAGAPDKNDWLKDCADQATVYSLLKEAIECLESMI